MKALLPGAQHRKARAPWIRELGRLAGEIGAIWSVPGTGRGRRQGATMNDFDPAAPDKTACLGMGFFYSVVRLFEVRDSNMEKRNGQT